MRLEWVHVMVMEVSPVILTLLSESSPPPPINPIYTLPPISHRPGI